MAEVRFEQATRIFRGAPAPAVDSLELKLEDGELLVLVGPSGSGKSTALRMLAGLEEVDIGALQRRLEVTTLYVTHDQVEAMTMGQRVAVLKDGRLQQVGAPRELYNRPANVFVAGFIGSPAMNLVNARLNGEGSAQLDHMQVQLLREVSTACGERGLREVVIGLRPESLEVGEVNGASAS